jgi:ABC-2 type transport system ATP-binding protein
LFGQKEDFIGRLSRKDREGSRLILGIALNLQEARKVYPNGTEALRGIDLVIQEGEAIGLIGPNAAGKTTLAKLVVGLLEPTSGRIELWGSRFGQLPRSMKEKIGFLPEGGSPFESLTVEENIIFWEKLYGISKIKGEEALKEWGLWEFRKKRAKTLSQGMKRRLMIAQVTLHQPSLLVMDEPTSSLDPVVRRNTVDLLRGFANSERTLLITSHDLFDVERICTRIVILRHGLILAQGSMEELQRKLGATQQVRVETSVPIPEALRESLVERFRIESTSPNEFFLSQGHNRGELIRFLVESGVDIELVEEKKETLEDIYIKMVKEDEER